MSVSTPARAKTAEVAEEASRLVVWKFGGTSVEDHDRLRAVAERLVAAQRQGRRVVAVLSAMGKSTDGLSELAYRMSALPPRRELDARALTALDAAGIEPQLVTTTPGRVTAYISATLVHDAVRLLHDIFIPQADDFIPQADDAGVTVPPDWFVPEFVSNTSVESTRPPEVISRESTKGELQHFGYSP